MKIRYCVHKSMLLVPILCQMNPAHSVTLCFSKIHSNIIFLSVSRSSECLFSFRLSNQNFVCISCYLPCMFLCPTHVIILALITLVIFGEPYKLRSSSLCIFLQPPSASCWVRISPRHPVLIHSQSMVFP